MNRDEGACRDGVMAPDGPAGKDCEDGQKQARGKPAANAVGDGGAVTAKTPRMTSIPSHQRATDSHNYTRLGWLKSCQLIQCAMNSSHCINLNIGIVRCIPHEQRVALRFHAGGHRSIDLCFSIYEPKRPSIIFSRFLCQHFPRVRAANAVEHEIQAPFLYFESLTGVYTNAKKHKLIRIFNTSTAPLCCSSSVVRCCPQSYSGALPDQPAFERDRVRIRFH